MNYTTFPYPIHIERKLRKKDLDRLYTEYETSLASALSSRAKPTIGKEMELVEIRKEYELCRFDMVADTYWKKWTTKQVFWDYIKLIKYYDLSLFDHLRKLSPGRAQKTLGILIDPTMLERNKVIMGKKPSMENLRKEREQWDPSRSKIQRVPTFRSYQ